MDAGKLNALVPLKPIRLVSCSKITYQPDWFVATTEDGYARMYNRASGACIYTHRRLNFFDHVARNIPAPEIIAYTAQTFDWGRIADSVIYKQNGEFGPVAMISNEGMHDRDGKLFIDFADAAKHGTWLSDGDPCGTIKVEKPK